MNSVVTKDQGMSIAERVIYGIAMALGMKFVAWGYIEADMAPYFAAGAVSGIGSAYAWWINRPKAIVQAAANLPGTTVVTTADLSAATPDQANIVSNTENKVVNK